MSTIKNPIEWSVAQLASASGHAGEIADAVRGSEPSHDMAAIDVRRLKLSDLRGALASGMSDTLTSRTDIMALCLIYPLVGLVMTWVAFDYSLLPLLFPIASGFALVAPVAAVGLYELSRRNESGHSTGWGHAFAVLASPSFGAIFILGLGLVMIFALWLFSAQVIYGLTLGPEPPTSVTAFASSVFGTPEGWTMMAVGLMAGFLFAAVVLAISVVSFPLLLDRKVGLRRAVTTSLEVTARSPLVVGVWGLVIALLLLAGSLPLFLGLIFVMPVLGHATWHLYRRAVAAPNAGPRSTAA